MTIYKSNYRKPRDIVAQEKGFTLIELSIVLVIIGLIVGGVLVGQDLIRAAEVRATVSQLEKYNTAVNTFKGKYNAIPGDMNLATATQFGFTTTGRGAAGQGDGNGLVDGGSAAAVGQGWGETGMFWVDLSSTIAGNLVDGSFTLPTYAAPGSAVASTAIPSYLPTAKLGRGNYVYVFETAGYNYYGVAQVTGIATTGSLTSASSMAVMQAYNIDKKTDDGIANAGNVQAKLVSALAVAAASSGSPDTTATCFNSTTGAYSVGAGTNNGQGPNCSVIFQFQ